MASCLPSIAARGLLPYAVAVLLIKMQLDIKSLAFPHYLRNACGARSTKSANTSYAQFGARTVALPDAANLIELAPPLSNASQEWVCSLEGFSGVAEHQRCWAC